MFVGSSIDGFRMHKDDPDNPDDEFLKTLNEFEFDDIKQIVRSHYFYPVLMAKLDFEKSSLSGNESFEVAKNNAETILSRDLVISFVLVKEGFEKWIKSEKRTWMLTRKDNRYSNNKIYVSDVVYVAQILCQERDIQLIKFMETLPKWKKSNFYKCTYVPLKNDPKLPDISDDNIKAIQSNALANKYLQKYEDKNFWVDLRNPIYSSLVMFTITFILILIIWWTLTYPHSGWKRLSIATLPLGGIGIWMWTERIDDYGMPIWFLITLAMILWPAFILLGREVFYWVIGGFSLEGNRPK
jgi:heme-degrading monooxygenase HmoA